MFERRREELEPRVELQFAPPCGPPPRHKIIYDEIVRTMRSLRPVGRGVQIDSAHLFLLPGRPPQPPLFTSPLVHVPLLHLTRC